jgi:hypothetical protein
MTLLRPVSVSVSVSVSVRVSDSVSNTTETVAKFEAAATDMRGKMAFVRFSRSAEQWGCCLVLVFQGCESVGVSL